MVSLRKDGNFIGEGNFPKLNRELSLKDIEMVLGWKINQTNTETNNTSYPCSSDYQVFFLVFSLHPESTVESSGVMVSISPP